jgi:hypothetical protein
MNLFSHEKIQKQWEKLNYRDEAFWAELPLGWQAL